MPVAYPESMAVLLAVLAATSVVTGPAGTYRIVLSPGVYTVRIVGLRTPQRLAPGTAVVRRGVMARQPFVIDTGIR
jgi:hypothetical protein